MFLIHVRNSCSCNLNFLLAAHKPDVPERRTKHNQAMNNFLHRDNHASQNDSTQGTLSEDSPHDHPESKQTTVQHSHFQKAVCKGTELHSTHAQTESSFRQTGAVTWHLLTEMQKHSPKVS